MNNTEQLRLISIFHYVFGVLQMGFGLFGMIYLGMGIFMLVSPQSWASDGAPPPPIMGWIFTAIGAVWVLSCLVNGVLTIISGRCMARRVRRNFSMVIAGINCLFVPLGTLLGVFTLIVLSNNLVIEEYNNPGENRAGEMASRTY